MGKEFIAAHRPKLRVRKLALRPGMQFNSPSVEVTNIGDTPALIVESHCQLICCGSEARAIGDFDDAVPNNPFPQEEILSGKSIGAVSLKFDDKMRSALFKTEVLTGDDATGALYAIGWVRYRDKNDTVRRTGFCRRRNLQSGLFLAGNDTPSDYEYED
jgi:hypothetical protein